jgi:pimeloyl-ACP methyl ester carboxylesterase
LLRAAGGSILAAAVCSWGALCLLFWQGGWQLLYHPVSAVTRTPASVGLAFIPVAFAATEAGEPRLKGWWIAAGPDAPYSHYTVLYLHGQNGNLGDTVDEIVALHEVGVNVLAFDYRGYGQSEFQHPSEAGWREDVEWSLTYLTATRHVAAGSIILDGSALGANLALEVAAAHSELAGVVLESPLNAPVDDLFNDARARMVPAHLLVRDRFDAELTGSGLRIPSLWLIQPTGSLTVTDRTKDPSGYKSVEGRKMLVWLPSAATSGQEFVENYTRWLDDLPTRTGNP